jgi:hypothetical protein
LSKLKSIDRKKKEAYIKQFMSTLDLDKSALLALCKLYKESTSLNGIYNAILKAQISALKQKEKEGNNGKSFC